MIPRFEKITRETELFKVELLAIAARVGEVNPSHETRIFMNVKLPTMESPRRIPRFNGKRIEYYVCLPS
jgi:hypothetical protein